MNLFLNQIKAQAAQLDQAIGQPRLGLVSSVDCTRGTVRVRLQPEDVLSGWLPLLTPWIGAGWGIACPPSPGDQVLVLPQEGDAEHGVVLGGVFSQVQAPPTDAGAVPQSGEFWLVHATGSFLRLRNDGSIEGNAAIWRIKGDMHVDGDIYDQHGAMSALRGHYDGHSHTDSRGGLTSAPNQQD